MKKYLIQALFIGSFGMILFILNLTLGLELIHPLVLPVLIIFAVALSETVITFKVSTGLPAPVVMVRALQTNLLSTVVVSLPMLASTGYYWLLQREYPGIRYRDYPEVAFSVFLFMLEASVILSFVLGLVAGLVARGAWQKNSIHSI